MGAGAHKCQKESEEKQRMFDAENAAKIGDVSNPVDPLRPRIMTKAPH